MINQNRAMKEAGANTENINLLIQDLREGASFGKALEARKVLWDGIHDAVRVKATAESQSH
ncbi:hypothetical protein Belba_1143 [Belliella baltica DSM 15883]|uniref:Uncharacterized protein n=1 Tax=Belliella baltica (strain DSM 15883 / CIP 108006 / LMG 21964 / BA134) TaxID=866536 RepID=I3Z3G1_BELBD|nr:hypothetical protein [Belliella baltica]AFL83779.1 hypothetical protein Belba_1143 [Belliella baltica DSM 15883]